MTEMNRIEIEALLAGAAIGRLGMAGRDLSPYVIPLPFCLLDGALYLRLPMTGRKGRVLAENQRVCFEVDRFQDDLGDYASVLLEGRLVQVPDRAEKECVKAANESKYLRLRGANRRGHGRQTRPEDLPLQKILVSSLSGRKKEGASPKSSVAAVREPLPYGRPSVRGWA